MSDFRMEDFRADDRAVIAAAEKSLGEKPSMLALMGYQALIHAMQARYYYAGSKFGWLRFSQANEVRR